MDFTEFLDKDLRYKGFSLECGRRDTYRLFYGGEKIIAVPPECSIVLINKYARKWLGENALV